MIVEGVPPLQIVSSLAIIPGVTVFTVTTVAADVAEHPLPSVTVTEYEPDELTVIDCVVAPLLHNHDVPADAVSITEPPAQNVVGPPAVIVAVGNGFTITVAVPVCACEQPLTSLTLTSAYTNVPGVVVGTATVTEFPDIVVTV